jgi:hypothetical protein
MTHLPAAAKEKEAHVTVVFQRSKFHEKERENVNAS